MATPKTSRTKKSVSAFLNGVKDDRKRRDAKRLVQIMKRITGERPAMWGPSIVGFGSYHYVYASGREGDWMLTGFSPRKQTLTIYIMCGFQGHKNLMKDLGSYSTGVSCLYVKSLDDIDLKVLERLIRESVKLLRKKYGR